MQVDYIIKKSWRRTISISVDEDKRVIVKAPVGTSAYTVQNFLREKRDWIIKQINKIDQQEKTALQLGPLSQKDIIELKKKARLLIPQRVEHYAQLSGITYGRISIRLQKTRWGSCSAEGNLNFNCLLALMPVEVLDSVVVHELCHRRQMNHSRAFYDEVLRLYPEYKKYHRWLKKNGGAYFKRIVDSSEKFERQEL